MKIRALDVNNDWAFGSGLSSYNSADNCIAEDIKTAILSWAGDCFFSVDDFIDWKNLLDKNQFNNLKASLYNIISTRQGVVQVNTLIVEMVSRQFRASYNIDTIYTTNLPNDITIGV